MTSKDRIKVLQEMLGVTADGIIGTATLTAFMQKYGRNKIQTAHFFGNIHHESGGYSIVRENITTQSASERYLTFSTPVSWAEAIEQGLAGTGGTIGTFLSGTVVTFPYVIVNDGTGYQFLIDFTGATLPSGTFQFSSDISYLTDTV